MALTCVRSLSFSCCSHVLCTIQPAHPNMCILCWDLIKIAIYWQLLIIILYPHAGRLKLQNGVGVGGIIGSLHEL